MKFFKANCTLFEDFMQNVYFFEVFVENHICLNLTKFEPPLNIIDFNVSVCFQRFLICLFYCNKCLKISVNFSQKLKKTSECWAPNLQ